MLRIEKLKKVKGNFPVLVGSNIILKNICNIFKNKKRARHLNYPISLTPTPLGNIFSSSLGQSPIWKVSRDKIEEIPYQWHMPALDIVKCLFTFDPPSAPHPCPKGTLVEPERVSCVPEAAGWLGGLGAGSWFHIQKEDNNSDEESSDSV